MKNRFRSSVALGVATLVAVGTSVLGAAPAHAAVIGTLSFTPKYGADTTPMTVTSSGLCPSGTHIQVKVSGAGFPAGGYNVTANNQQSVVQSGSVYVISLGDTMRGFADAQVPPAVLSGEYVFDGFCRTSLSAMPIDEFLGSIWFTSPTAYQDIDPAGAPAATSVTVNAGTPASPQQAGVNVTFVATVANPGGQYPGTVQFRDGATAIGSPVAINTATGQASFSSSSLAVGTHQINAIFTPSKVPFTASPASANSAYTIDPAPAQNTVTSLAASPASGTANQYQDVTLTATVSPAGAGGTITFKDGAATLGTRSLAPGGSAVLTQTFASGAHSFTAEFAPTNPANFNASTSAAVPYTVAAFAGSVIQQQITTTVAAGELVISNNLDAVVTLATPVLTADGRYFFTTGSLDDVTVTDTRAGNPGWNVTGQVSQFSDGAPSPNTFSGAQLGWETGPFTADPAQTVTEGPDVAPNASSHGGPASTGLSVSSTLANAVDNEGNGSVVLDATLNLNVPTTVPAGTYTATLTLTAI